MGNTKLSEYFLALGRELDILEAKTPEDVYKVGGVTGIGGGCVCVS